MKIKVIELFAGVGGFRLGLEGDVDGNSSLSGYKKPVRSNYEVVWSNQYEPLTVRQHASEVYENIWGAEDHSRRDIEKVIEDNFDTIASKDFDMLVGGFPCQDYSVATTLRNSKGLIGKKGVLWWSIYGILDKLGANKPKYLFLENVDRLLLSPVKQRGRDFAVMLSCLYEQGYAVEWRVINAADYGMAQRRRRVYIVAYHKSSPLYKKIDGIDPKEVLFEAGVVSSAFPVSELITDIHEGKVGKDMEKVSNEFNSKGRLSPFNNSGFMKDGIFYTSKVKSRYLGKAKVLDDVVDDFSEEQHKAFLINKNKMLKVPMVKPQIDGKEYNLKTEWDLWKYLKGSKKELKTNKNQGYSYKYAEGAMIFPDELKSPSRTIITGEGGASPSRFKHVIEQDGIYRRLTPIELERLNMFPDNHTMLEGITDSKRAFFMGNALVVGIVERIGQSLWDKINQLDKSSFQSDVSKGIAIEAVD